MSIPASTRLVVGGIPLAIQRPIPSSTPSKEITILFFLHGRFGNKSDAASTLAINTILEFNPATPEKELIIVSFDQRNHGERLVDIDRNRAFIDDFSWLEKYKGEGLHNESHASDMYAIQIGTTKDVSFLIDVLPAALFPNDESLISNFWISGVSLGGHVSWLSVANEPRITLAIPIIGGADYLTLLSERAATLEPPFGPIPIAAPFFPKSLLKLVKELDPVNQAISNYKNKVIYCLSGEDDQLVNFQKGGTSKFVEKLRAGGVKIDYVIQEGCGHRCSKEMATLAAQFIQAQLALPNTLAKI